MAKKSFDIGVNKLVPKHTKLSETEKNKLLEKHSITVKELPKIFIDDPAIAALNLKAGDVVKIERSSPTAGTTVYYRGVINE